MVDRFSFFNSKSSGMYLGRGKMSSRKVKKLVRRVKVGGPGDWADVNIPVEPPLSRRNKGFLSIC